MPNILTEEQIAAYRRDGYVLRVPALSNAEAAAARRELEAVEASFGGAIKGLARSKFHLRYPWSFKIATAPAILDAVEDLIGPDIMLYQNTIWAKNADESSYVSWHQDNTYFGFEPCETLSVWVALSPSRPESGSMRFLKGSHTLGQLPVTYETRDSNMLSSGQIALVDHGAFEAVPASLSPGEASIHHAWMVHGSPPNSGKDRRIGMTFVYFPPHQKQLGNTRTGAILVRGRDRYGHFEREEPPLSADDPATIARHERGAGLYRAKAEELGNHTIARHDRVEA